MMGPSRPRRAAAAPADAGRAASLPWLQTAPAWGGGERAVGAVQQGVIQTKRACEGRALSCGRRGRCRGSAPARTRSQNTSAAAAGRNRQGPGGGRAPPLPGSQPRAAQRRCRARARAGRGAARRGDAGARPSRWAGGLDGRVSPCSDAPSGTARAMPPGIRAALRLGERAAEVRGGRCESCARLLRSRARPARGARGGLRAPVRRRPAVGRQPRRRPAGAKKRPRACRDAPMESQSSYGGAGVASFLEFRESEMV